MLYLFMCMCICNRFVLGAEKGKGEETEEMGETGGKDKRKETNKAEEKQEGEGQRRKEGEGQERRKERDG